MRRLKEPKLTCFTDKPFTYIDQYGANVVIDYSHSKNHDGDFFFFSDSYTLAGSGVSNFVLEVGAYDLHYVYSISAENAGFTFITYEDITANANGTLSTINNRNRTSINVSSAVLRLNPTNVVTTGKLILRKGQSGVGGAPSSRTAGSVSDDDEIILRPNTKYLLRITNLSTSDNIININMKWYETE